MIWNWSYSDSYSRYGLSVYLNCEAFYLYLAHQSTVQTFVLKVFNRMSLRGNLLCESPNSTSSTQICFRLNKKYIVLLLHTSVGEARSMYLLITSSTSYKRSKNHSLRNTAHSPGGLWQNNSQTPSDVWFNDNLHYIFWSDDVLWSDIWKQSTFKTFKKNEKWIFQPTHSVQAHDCVAEKWCIRSKSTGCLSLSIYTCSQV